MKKKTTGLGRGISALIPECEFDQSETQSEYFMCLVDEIAPNRFQPRTVFDQKEQNKLTKSVKQQGLLQPLLIRHMDNAYELIAGERRLRAAKEAGLTHVPVIVKDLTDVQVLEVSIIENIQRENLNVLEEAEAYHRLIQEFHYTQEKVAEKIGKNRSTIANLLRLRNLPEIIKEGIVNQQIAMGHARALLGVEPEETQIRLFHKVVEKHLSVRETEKLVNNTKKIAENIKAEENGSEKQFLDQTSKLLSERIKSRVHIRKKGEKGKIEINFKSKDEFQNLINLFSSI
jgi:ParB family transcriptional regulator, chromosome partitioning protein